ncbi:MAG: hypothetical protein ACI8ZB_000272 [Desulforhopalus sp.]|jgi:hypothetical protein
MKLFNIFVFVFVFSLLLIVESALGVGLEEWTGNHSRLTWVQDQGNGSDTFGQGNNLRLYGYDSKDGKGERPLVKQVGNYFKPIFTPDGQYVIYSDRKAREMFLLNWETGDIQKLGSGVAVAVWQDTKASFFLRKKTVWVYCFSGLQPENKYGTGQPLYRFPLDNPKKKELIWNKSNMAWSNVQLSRDGEVLGGLFPWPNGGVLSSDKKTFTRFGKGCWISVSPDNSKLLWIFDGLHRNVQIHDVNSGETWKVNINSAPGIGGLEVYHPRWSNNPRYFVITGPYAKGEGGNKIGGGGDKIEVYVGRFDTSARSVEDWIQVTHNSKADFFPDLWVEGGELVELNDTLLSAADTAIEVQWPKDSENLIYVWEDMKGANQLAETGPVGFYQCNLYLKDKALFSRDFALQARGGWGGTGDAAQNIRKSLSKSGELGVELLVTPDEIQEGVVFSLQAADKKHFSLVQVGEDIVLVDLFSSETGKEIKWAGVFSAGEATHLLLSVKKESVELFKNGKSLGRKKMNTHLVGIAVASMTLGDTAGLWRGTFSHIAVYNTPPEEADILMNSTYCLAKVGKTKAADRLVVQAELLETTEIPAPESIGAYRRALVVNSYTVNNIVSGQYSEEKILVAEWAVLDRQVVKKYVEENGPEQLLLEKFDDHPELEGERQMMDIFEPDLTMYYRLN